MVIRFHFVVVPAGYDMLLLCVTPAILFSFRGENGFTLRLETARWYHFNCGKDCKASPPAPGGGGEGGRWGEKTTARVLRHSPQRRGGASALLARAADLPSVGLWMSPCAKSSSAHQELDATNSCSGVTKICREISKEPINSRSR
jgi:hypothetical protein